jgi:hypothetical protein
LIYEQWLFPLAKPVLVILGASNVGVVSEFVPRGDLNVLRSLMHDHGTIRHCSQPISIHLMAVHLFLSWSGRFLVLMSHREEQSGFFPLFSATLSGIVLEKAVLTQLENICETRRFITAYTRALRCTLSRAN